MDKSLRRRVTLLFTIFMLVFFGVVAKLIWTIVIEGDELRAAVQEDKIVEAKLQADRGRIYERKGQLLAYTDTRYKISIRVKASDDIYKSPIRDIVEDIAPLVEMSESEIYTILENRGESKSVFIKYVEDRKVADKIRFTFHQQLGVDPEIERKYPNGKLASDILGMTKYSDDFRSVSGILGIEKEYNEELEGEDGYYRAEVDQNQIELVYTDPVNIAPVSGHDIYLTIDGVLQYHLEQALLDVFQEQDAISAHGLILNVKTGEVIAMASVPDFNPESRTLNIEDFDVYGERARLTENEILSRVPANDWIQYSYELGSPIKLLTAAIALENDLYTLETMFPDENAIKVGDRLIKSWYYPRMYRNLDLKESISISHNPAFVRMGLALGAETMYNYFDDFGLYSRTNIDLPGEVLGSFFDREGMENEVQLATTTFGQGNAYTPIQVAMALATLVNDGKLMEPHVVKAIKAEDGSVVYEAEPTVVRNVISPITSQQIREAMTYTVETGSGGAAKIDGLTVGGKTGTAQKPNPSGGYYDQKVVASFVAVAPMEDPEFLVYIIVDEPTESLFGSQVCGPVAKTVMEDVAEFYDLYSYDTDLEEYPVPSVVGLTVEEAKEVLEEEGFYGKVLALKEYDDDAIVSVQYPNAGSLRVHGKAILLELNID